MLLRPGHRALRAVAAAAALVAALAVALPGAALAAPPSGHGHGKPRRPEIVSGPAISGTAQVGSVLTASATWTGGAPVSAAWAWLRCPDTEPEHCLAIPDATSATYVPVPGDAGSRLRVRLTVSNDAGWVWRVPEATDPVAAGPPPVPTPAPVPPVTAPAPPTGAVKGEQAKRPARVMRPRPVVRVRGWLTRTGAHVTALTVRAPHGARVAVRCSGGGCPQRSWSRTHRHGRLVHLSPFERTLPAGTRLTVTVTKRGSIGKRTLIRIRRGHAPSRVDRCLRPGSSRVRACPAA